jgi:hypothetical protein
MENNPLVFSIEGINDLDLAELKHAFRTKNINLDQIAQV